MLVWLRYDKESSSPHNETVQEHLRKKNLSCTKCHLLFATFNELDSHFHRIHRKKTSSAGAETAASGAGTPSADNKTAGKVGTGQDNVKSEVCWKVWYQSLKLKCEFLDDQLKTSRWPVKNYYVAC